MIATFAGLIGYFMHFYAILPEDIDPIYPNVPPWGVWSNPESSFF
jgi:hypothetical protein